MQLNKIITVLIAIMNLSGLGAYSMEEQNSKCMREWESTDKKVWFFMLLDEEGFPLPLTFLEAEKKARSLRARLPELADFRELFASGNDIPEDLDIECWLADPTMDFNTASYLHSSHTKIERDIEELRSVCFIQDETTLISTPVGIIEPRR